MAELASVHAIVNGRVQGVCFRAFVSECAVELELAGYVRNLRGMEAVEIQAEGEKDRLEKLVDYLKIGPPASRVERVVTEWSEFTGGYSGFSIRY